MKQFILLVVLPLAILACRTGNPDRKLNLYPSPTSDATQTPVIQTVVSTKVVQITTTPIPTVPTFTSTPISKLCVSAVEAVHMRPAPSMESNMTELPNGAEVTDLGGRSREWLYVEWEGKRGWINGKYLKNCN